MIGSARGWTSVAVALVLFGIYRLTLAPSIGIGDSGELVTAAATLGIAHPPGYPLWCLVMHPFTMLPGVSPAFAVNLATALSSSVAAALVAWIAAGRLAAPPFLAGAVALVHGVSPVLWSQSIVAEVYAFNLVVVLGLVAATLSRASASPLVPFLSALALVSHGSNAGIVGVVVVLWARRAVRGADRARSVILGGVAALVGLSPLLYLPVRSATLPALDWGHPADLHAFLAHVTRAQYGGLSWPPAGVLVDMLAAWWRADSAGALTTTLGPLAVLGVVTTSRCPRRGERPPGTDVAGAVRTLALLAGIAIVGGIASVASGLHGEQLLEPEVFWIPSYALLALLAAHGIAALGRGASRVGAPAAVAAALALTILGWPRVDRADSWIAEDYGRALLTSMPERAVLYVTADYQAFSIMYLQTIEHLRPDVSLRTVDAPPARDAYGHRAPPLRTLVGGDRPIFVTVPKPPFDALPTTPEGLAFRVGNTEPSWTPISLRHPDDRVPSVFERSALYAVRFHEAAYRFAIGDEAGAVRSAAAAARCVPDLASALSDLATLLATNGVHDRADHLWRRAVELDPTDVRTWRNLILLQELLERPGEAARLAARARAHHPGVAEFRR